MIIMNTKIFKLLSTLVIILFVINSCKKSHDLHPPIDLNGLYVASSSLDLSAVQMYTMNGQVTNQDVIKAYIAGHGVSDYFFIGVQSKPYPDNTLRISFKNNTSAIVNGSYANANSDSAKYTITQRSGSGFILEAVDTLRTLEYINSRTDILAQNANKINSYSNCSPMDPASGYNASVCTYRDARPFVIKDGKLYMSFLTFDVVTHNGSVTNGGYIFTTGIFNPDIVKQMVDKDTLIVQPQLLLLTKQ